MDGRSQTSDITLTMVDGGMTTPRARGNQALLIVNVAFRYGLVPLARGPRLAR